LNANACFELKKTKPSRARLMLPFGARLKQDHANQIPIIKTLFPRVSRMLPAGRLVICLRGSRTLVKSI